MDYIVAQYRIRTEGTNCDLVECGLAGFRPFEVETALSVAADLTVRFGENLTPAKYTKYKSKNE